MVSHFELQSQWQKALTLSHESGEEECTSILWENDWVRILAILNEDADDLGRIEVEVSLPSHQDFQSAEDVKTVILNLIRHLEYLLRLDEEGLILSVVSRDGLWTGIFEVDCLPSDSLFKALVPPSL